MSEPGPKPLFLARRTYRRRRLRDAARLYPLLAVFLFVMPVLWGPVAGEVQGRATAGDAIYLLVVWAGLILGAWLIARALGRDVTDGDEPSGPVGAGGPAVPVGAAGDGRAE